MVCFTMIHNDDCFVNRRPKI